MQRIFNQSDKYVFKKCLNFIVILKKPRFFFGNIDLEFKCNEGRENIINKQFAKYRANGFYVQAIIDYNTLEEIGILIHYYKKKHIIYEVGKLVTPDHFDNNLNLICGRGIHYFITLRAAYYYDSKKLTSFWNSNGAEVEGMKPKPIRRRQKKHVL